MRVQYHHFEIQQRYYIKLSKTDISLIQQLKVPATTKICKTVIWIAWGFQTMTYHALTVFFTGSSFLFKSALNVLCSSSLDGCFSLFSRIWFHSIYALYCKYTSIYRTVHSYPLPRSACQLSVDMSSEKKLNQLSSNHGGDVRRWRRGGDEES